MTDLAGSSRAPIRCGKVSEAIALARERGQPTACLLPSGLQVVALPSGVVKRDTTVPQARSEILGQFEALLKEEIGIGHAPDGLRAGLKWAASAAGKMARGVIMPERVGGEPGKVGGEG